MRVKGLIDEDFTQYKKPAMFIITPSCSFKCDREYGKPICQNSELANAPIIEIDDDKLVKRYLDNPITQSIVFGGMEPFDNFNEILNFIKILRSYSEDDIIIYTGYNIDEINDKLVELKKFKNIVIKVGRYIPNQEQHFDEILGIKLASDNQYAIQL